MDNSVLGKYKPHTFFYHIIIIRTIMLFPCVGIWNVVTLILVVMCNGNNSKRLAETLICLLSYYIQIWYVNELIQNISSLEMQKRDKCLSNKIAIL